jgi:hypothetical protein
MPPPKKEKGLKSSKSGGLFSGFLGEWCHLGSYPLHKESLSQSIIHFKIILVLVSSHAMTGSLYHPLLPNPPAVKQVGSVRTTSTTRQLSPIMR